MVWGPGGGRIWALYVRDVDRIRVKCICGWHVDFGGHNHRAIVLNDWSSFANLSWDNVYRNAVPVLR